MVNANRIGAPVLPNVKDVLEEQRPGSSHGSMFSLAASNGYEGAESSPPPSATTPQEMEMSPDFFFEKTWSQCSAYTTHMVRAASSNCFFVSRRFSRLGKVLTTTVALLCLFLIFGHIHLGLSQSMIISSSYYSSSASVISDNGIAATGFEARGHHIPPQIWQVMFTPRSNETGGYDFDESLLPYTASWLAKNPDYRYTVVGTEGANRFVMKHFGDEPRVLETHFGLHNHGPRSDLMRYLIMLAEGGIYSDTDVTCLRPVDTWISEEWRQDVKAVVGIEGDSLGGEIIDGMIWDVQFGQWT